MNQVIIVRKNVLDKLRVTLERNEIGQVPKCPLFALKSLQAWLVTKPGTGLLEKFPKWHWKMKTATDKRPPTTYHRQFLLDRSVSKMTIIDGSKANNQASDLIWWFQDWHVPRKTGLKAFQDAISPTGG